MNEKCDDTCPHCESNTYECLWWEFHDGNEAPCGAQQPD